MPARELDYACPGVILIHLAADPSHAEVKGIDAEFRIIVQHCREMHVLLLAR
jgi:hypothetical protein